MRLFKVFPPPRSKPADADFNHNLSLVQWRDQTKPLSLPNRVEENFPPYWSASNQKFSNRHNTHRPPMVRAVPLPVRNKHAPNRPEYKK
jgi:hypothetical protein